MKSLYDELAARLDRDPSLARRGGARGDIGILLFGARDELRDLWIAAERELLARDEASADELRAAIERLRPLFGEREGERGEG